MAVILREKGDTLPETNKSPWKIHHFDGIYQERWDFHGQTVSFREGRDDLFPERFRGPRIWKKSLPVGLIRCNKIHAEKMPHMYYRQIHVYIYIAWKSKTKQRMVFRMIHGFRIPYYQWAKFGLWTSRVYCFAYRFSYVCKKSQDVFVVMHAFLFFIHVKNAPCAIFLFGPTKLPCELRTFGIFLSRWKCVELKPKTQDYLVRPGDKT